MAEKKVKVRLKPLHNIGGVGNAGDVTWLSAEDAQRYFENGYVEYVADEQPTQPALEIAADHEIMKPATPRRNAGKRKRK